MRIWFLVGNRIMSRQFLTISVRMWLLMGALLIWVCGILLVMFCDLICVSGVLLYGLEVLFGLLFLFVEQDKRIITD